MHLSSLLAAGLIGVTFAAPTISEARSTSDAATSCYCLSAQDAQDAANVFQELIQEYSDDLALAVLTEDFIDYSSAVNIIINRGNETPKPLADATFVGRQAFMNAQGSQPEIPFKQLRTFHGCDNVSMRWMTKQSARGQKTEANDLPVVGNVIIETVAAAPGDRYNFRIKTIFSEFNAAAWLINLGVFVAPPPANATAPSAPRRRSIAMDGSLRGNMI